MTYDPRCPCLPRYRRGMGEDFWKANQEHRLCDCSCHGQHTHPCPAELVRARFPDEPQRGCDGRGPCPCWPWGRAPERPREIPPQPPPLDIVHEAIVTIERS